MTEVILPRLEQSIARFPPEQQSVLRAGIAAMTPLEQIALEIEVVEFEEWEALRQELSFCGIVRSMGHTAVDVVNTFMGRGD